MVEIPEALPNNEGFGGIPLDLMSEHPSAADQAAFEEAIEFEGEIFEEVVTSFGFGVDLPRPGDSMFDNVGPVAAEANVEPVAVEADVEPVVAEANETDDKPLLQPTAKSLPKARPTVNPARVVVATSSKAASVLGAAAAAVAALPKAQGF